MARNVNKRLIAVSSAAIIGIYAAAYTQTQSAADRASVAVAAQSSRSLALATAPRIAPPVPTATAIARAIAATTTAPTATPSPAAAGVALRAGTYSGSGTSRRGDIQVSLVIQGGAITAVQITRATTYYPVSDVARLRDEVLTRQGAPIHYVSGATESSRAFRAAVTAALTQAAASGATVAPSRTGA